MSEIDTRNLSSARISSSKWKISSTCHTFFDSGAEPAAICPEGTAGLPDNWRVSRSQGGMTRDGTISLGRVPSLGQERVRRVASLALRPFPKSGRCGRGGMGSRACPTHGSLKKSWDLDRDPMQRYCISGCCSLLRCKPWGLGCVPRCAVAWPLGS